MGNEPKELKDSLRYYVQDKLEDYTTDERNELASELEHAGFEYFMFQGGGGFTEEIEQTIAMLNLNQTLIDIALGVTANRLDSALSAIYKWTKNHKKKNRRSIKQVVDVYIYKSGNNDKHSYFVRFKADKKYTKKEIKEALNELK